MIFKKAWTLYRKSDEWVLKRCERLAHMAEKHFGIGCFGIAKVNLVLFTGCVLTYLGLGILYGPLNSPLWHVAFLLFSLGWGLPSFIHAYLMIHDMERLSLTNFSGVNPLKQYFFPIRSLQRTFAFIATTILDIFLLKDAEGTSMILFVFAGSAPIWIGFVFYFIVCDQKPKEA
ncbi:MAG: hypothetical protein HYW89_04605 [Candidatus Sungiibacteriota bacterium]|uniref:Uncharacterized protein n=1 Tax=Candidatus Sungiibacteriota bacterium TaxID=2750080 RepID=A0A7T5RJD5_9BACT|nr:MAG: hypothetical protein HYW89_04605 [Candidatus Sungbacteria bacterium]